jgi:ABC-type transporter Mla maintaining outer membrane lipid asymmetry ATPase subunit MlaF
MPNAISTRHLSRSFGQRKAVDDLNIDIQQGELFSLLLLQTIVCFVVGIMGGYALGTTALAVIAFRRTMRKP